MDIHIDRFQNKGRSVSKGLTIKGGYDSIYNTRPDYTTVQGKMTLSGHGRVIVDKLKIR